MIIQEKEPKLSTNANNSNLKLTERLRESKSDGVKIWPCLCCFQVIMSTKEAAERACKEPNPIIDGRKANVNLAILGAKPRGNALQSE